MRFLKAPNVMISSGNLLVEMKNASHPTILQQPPRCPIQEEVAERGTKEEGISGQLLMGVEISPELPVSSLKRKQILAET